MTRIPVLITHITEFTGLNKPVGKFVVLLLHLHKQIVLILFYFFAALKGWILL